MENMTQLISWANTNSGFLSFLLTTMYIIATIFIYSANRSAVKEMKASRINESRPYVIATFEVEERGPVIFVIKNIGKSIAKNVQFITNPKLINPPGLQGKPLCESSLIKDGIPCLPPGHSIQAFFGMQWDFKEDDQGIRPKYTFQVSYEDTAKIPLKYNDTYVFDFETQSEILHAPQKKMHDLVQAIEKLAKK